MRVEKERVERGASRERSVSRERERRKRESREEC